jgi:hypothetical protein
MPQDFNPYNFHSACKNNMHNVLFSWHEYPGTTNASLEMLKRDTVLLPQPHH